MLCDKCKKHPASVIIHQNINGNVTEYNLCAECAAASAGSVSFDTIVKGFMNSVMGLPSFAEIPGEEIEDISCPSCKLTYDGFKSTGKLGCADCYNSFRKQLLTLFKNVHGSASHTGKLPKRSGSELIKLRETDMLKDRLKKHIELEEFEEAAKIRDIIKGMKENG